MGRVVLLAIQALAEPLDILENRDSAVKVALLVPAEKAVSQGLADFLVKAEYLDLAVSQEHQGFLVLTVHQEYRASLEPLVKTDLMEHQVPLELRVHQAEVDLAEYQDLVGEEADYFTDTSTLQAHL